MTEKIIVAFTASWCGPCNRLKPYIKKLSEEYPTEFVDIDEQPERAKNANIKMVPAIVFQEDGVEKERLLNPLPSTLKQITESFFN